MTQRNTQRGILSLAPTLTHSNSLTLTNSYSLSLPEGLNRTLQDSKVIPGGGLKCNRRPNTKSGECKNQAPRTKIQEPRRLIRSTEPFGMPHQEHPHNAKTVGGAGVSQTMVKCEVSRWGIFLAPGNSHVVTTYSRMEKLPPRLELDWLTDPTPPISTIQENDRYISLTRGWFSFL